MERTYVVRGRLSICASGVCGDPYQEVSPLTNIAAITNYPIQATYTSGQTVTFTIKMQVNHGGRMTFRLCDRRTDLNQACFNARTLLRSVYLHGELVIRPITTHITLMGTWRMKAKTDAICRMEQASSCMFVGARVGQSSYIHHQLSNHFMAKD